MSDKGRESVPVLDGLRLAVEYRLNTGHGATLAAVSGVSLVKLKRFAKTGEIDPRERAILEVLQ